MAEKTLEVILRGRDHMTPAFKRASFSVGGLVRKLGGLRTIMAGLGVVGVGAVLRNLSDEFVGFEKRMARVRVLSRATADEFAALNHRARELGSTTEFAPRQVAEGMERLAQAGLGVSGAYRGVADTLNLATAGELDVAEAAELAVKVMAGMQIPVSKLSDTVDVMARAATSATTDVRQLAEGMSFVGPAAHGTGGSLRSTVASLQVLANANIAAERGGTALRNILVRLTGAQGMAAETMKRLKIEVADGSGNMRLMSDIVDQFNRKLAGMGNVEKLRELAKIFEQRGATNFLALMSAGGDEIRNFENRLDSAGGAAAEFREAFLDTEAGIRTIFFSALSDLKIEVGQAMTDVNRAFFEGMTSAVNVLRDAVGPMQAAIGQAMAVVSQTVGVGMQRVAGWITNTVNFIVPIWSSAWNFVAAIVRATLEAVSLALNTVLTFFGEVFGQIGDIFAAFGVTVRDVQNTWVSGFATMEFAVMRWRDILELGIGVASRQIIGLGKDVEHFFGTNIPEVLQFFADNWGEIWTNAANFAVTVMENLARNIVNILGALPDLISGRVELSSVLVDLTEGFKPALKKNLKLSDRELSELEKGLDENNRRLAGRLGRDLEDHVTKRLAESIAGSQTMGEAVQRFRAGLEREAPSLPDFGTDERVRASQPGGQLDGPGDLGLGGGGKNEALVVSARFRGLAAGQRNDELARLKELVAQQKQGNDLTRRLVETIERQGLGGALLSGFELTEGGGVR